MATINLIEEHQASPELKHLYQEIKSHFNLDFVPNVYKAMAIQGPEAMQMMWQAYLQMEQQWGLETLALIGLAVDVTKGCDYCTSFDTTMLKQMGYDDAKIEALVNMISMNNMYSSYVQGLGLEPDVTPGTMQRKKAA